MIEILAQSTQPELPWFWSNISTERLALYLAGFSVVIYAGLEILKQIGLRVLGIWFGWRKTAIELERDVEALAKVSPTTSIQPSPEDVERVKKMAGGE